MYLHTGVIRELGRAIYLLHEQPLQISKVERVIKSNRATLSNSHPLMNNYEHEQGNNVRYRKTSVLRSDTILLDDQVLHHRQ